MEGQDRKTPQLLENCLPLVLMAQEQRDEATCYWLIGNASTQSFRGKHSSIERVAKDNVSQGVCPDMMPTRPCSKKLNKDDFFVVAFFAEEDRWNYPEWTPCWKAGNRGLIN